jgi:small nuclear ribonucleoprotein (snRNP)-like protein
VTYPHKDTVVISMVLANHRVHMILVDYDSFVNILSIDVISYIGIDPSKMTHVKTLLIGTKDQEYP